MNSHSDIQKLLSAYCGDDLPQHERALVEQHLQGCSSCRAELAELQTTLRLIRSTPEVEPPPWLTTRIMARIREQQTEKRSWLERFFFPLHIKLPLEVVGLLVVCVTGYYLSRSVETELKSPRTLQEQPLPSVTPSQQPAPTQPPQPESRLQEPQQKTDPAPPSPLQPEAPIVKGDTPRPELQPLQQPRRPPSAATPGFAPAPPAYKQEQSAPAADSTAAPLRSAPAAERVDQSKEAVPEMKKKTRGGMVPNAENFVPATAGKASDRAVSDRLPQLMLRLTVTDRAMAADAVRTAALRNGGVVTDDSRLSSGRMTIRIPASRLNEFHDQLARTGRLTERPEPPAGALLLEVLVQW